MMTLMGRIRKNESEGYAKHKEAMAARGREKSAAGREIGPLPDVVDPERRERCKGDLLLFAKTYFPMRFPLPFGEAHIKAGAKLQQIAEKGGKFALAMPRGSGKSTLAIVAVLYAICYGLRRYVVLAQATADLAAKMLKSIKQELETNQQLYEDFPEICYPIRCLERIALRAKGQTLDGESTRIEWVADGIILPVIKGSVSSGSVIQVTGLTGAVRGFNRMGPNGEVIRPDMFIIDDFQTRESARSPMQTDNIMSIIKGDLLNSAGPNVEVAAGALCTVIYPNDGAEKLLSHELHPEFQGQRVRMLDTMPKNLELWDEYYNIRRDELRDGEIGTPRANAFYTLHRERMDYGASASWKERMKPTELSAIQSAMNLCLTDKASFMAEYQNEPVFQFGGVGFKMNDAKRIAKRVNGLNRGTIPIGTRNLSCFIDAGGELLWYCIAAWDERFNGSVIDYGCWPRQTRAMFAAIDARPTMKDMFPGLSEERRVYAGLDALTREILGTVYRDRNQVEYQIGRCLIDSGWNAETIHQFCDESVFKSILWASKGIARTTAGGVGDWRHRAEDRRGFAWRYGVVESKRWKTCHFDADTWKSFVHERLHSPDGSCTIKLYGDNATDHELFAEHCASEGSEPAGAKGEVWDKWEVLPHKVDNHLWDCMIGASVAANTLGVTFSAEPSGTPTVRKKRKINIEELYAAANNGGNR